MEWQLGQAEAKTRRRLETAAALARAVAEAQAAGGGGRGWAWRELADPKPVKGVRVKERTKRMTNTVPATWAYQQYGPGIRTVRGRYRAPRRTRGRGPPGGPGLWAGGTQRALSPGGRRPHRGHSSGLHSFWKSTPDSNCV
jgi:hypothetical protein